MAEIFVARADEIGEGQRRFVDHSGQEIGVLRVKGELRAYLNQCPHQGGPVCEGLLIHKVEEVIDANHCYQGMRFNPEQLNVVCPWHGWEFDVVSGASSGDGLWHLKSFKVSERAGEVYVHV